MTVVTPPQVGNTAVFRFDYPASAAGHFYYHQLTAHEPSFYPVPIPGFTSLGVSRVDLFNPYLQPTGWLDGAGTQLLSIGIPPDTFLVGLPFDLQSVDIDVFHNTVIWGGNDAEVAIAPVIPPVANFTATPTSGRVPLLVQFTDMSTQVGPTSTWQWDFDNDGTVDSTQQNPSHTYTTPGTFSVRLVAANVGGAHTLVRQQLVSTTSFAPPVASFEASALVGQAPFVVTFQDTSSNQPASWQWDFNGDGVVDSSQQNPTHVFTALGLYSVRLTAANLAGAGSQTRSNLVFVVPSMPNPALNMVPIRAGSFLMGSNAAAVNAQPVHEVSIARPFWAGKYEVTQSGYQAVMGPHVSWFSGALWPNSGQRPVESVTWSHAVQYCAALNSSESAAGRVPAGYQYRLPTEAEWEYVCRAGTTTEWSTGGSPTFAQANFQHINWPGGGTMPVGSYSANPWGLCDTHGNVWELCLDAWDLSANYPSSPVSDPFVSTGAYRVVRGGAWNSPPDNGRSAFRSLMPPGSYSYIGFRVVLAPVVVP
jgi:hypothetical protein